MMNTVIASRKMVDDRKVIVLDSDCILNIDAIKESIELVNKFNADYGLLTLWGIELTINPNDVAEEVLKCYQMEIRK